MRTVGVPPGAVAGMRQSPAWAVFESLAPTLAYDEAALSGWRSAGRPRVRGDVPTLVIGGGARPQPMRDAVAALAGLVATAAHVTLPEGTHDVSADALAPVLANLFAS